MKLPVIGTIVFVLVPVLAAQEKPAAEFTDPMALLQAVAENYADGADSFRLESIVDSEHSSELSHRWDRTYRTAIKGPGNLYRIEVRTEFGSYLQVSDGVSEWVYQTERNSYVKRPLPPDWPGFPRVFDMGHMEMKQAWEQRTILEDEALAYKRATMLPEATIVVEGHRYPCYVVCVSSEDSIQAHDKNFRQELTFWIDKQARVFRKIERDSETAAMVSNDLHIPMHMETTETYPVAEIDPLTTPEMFHFTPPADAKEVATLDPDFGGALPPEPPKANMVGQMAPDVAFTGPAGSKVQLSSFRGKPLLLDFWATWCGPCLVSMPAFNKLYGETKDKGLAIVSLDQNTSADDAAVYLSRHRYGWTNYHDEGRAVYKALKGSGIPLVVLIDAQGKIVYYDFGDNEAGLRKAIAGLAPEFAPIAPVRAEGAAAGGPNKATKP